MVEFKYNQIIRIPVKMVTTVGDPVANIDSAQVLITVEKANGTLVDFFPNGGQWIQIIQGAFNAEGKYTVLLPASYCDVPGLLTYAVKVTSAKTYFGAVKLIANEEAETKVVADALRTDYTTARAGKIDTILTTVTPMGTQLTDLVDYAQGKWEIKVTGPDANRLVLYRADGVTVLKKFDLANANGDATFINPFKRTPV
jgi:hypothetical protein